MSRIFTLMLTLGLTSGQATGIAEAEPDASDSTGTLKGGTEGTVFEDMTIEGEDRIRIAFDRPTMDLEIDPKSAPGLQWDHTLAVLERNSLSYSTPLIMKSRNDRTPYLPHPWFTRFRSGPVARFQPQVEGVDRWQLTVADSRGQTVALFEGEGKVPGEIAWDGLTLEGDAASPGLTYSYVFEAHDRAGNKRSFMGEPFELAPYRRLSARDLDLLFSGREVHAATSSKPLLLEAASWINQFGAPEGPIELEATARSYEEARNLAETVKGKLSSQVLGSPVRITETTRVLPDAPDGGTVRIHVSR